MELAETSEEFRARLHFPKIVPNDKVRSLSFTFPETKIFRRIRNHTHTRPFRVLPCCIHSLNVIQEKYADEILVRH